MTAITTRQTAGAGATVKGSPLTNTEVDNNFINIVTNKFEKSGDTAAYVTLDTAVTPVPGVAKLQWDPDNGTAQLGLVGGNVNLQLGQEELVYVLNKTGTAFTDMQVVRVVGAQGNRLEVALAQANGESTSANSLAVVTEPIANNAQGFATRGGLVNNIDTSTFAEGAALWLSPTTPGGITSTKPTAPNHLVLIGWCVRSHATIGKIFVHIQNGYELDELHDVLITGVATNDFLVRNGSVWENQTPAEARASMGLGSAALASTTDFDAAGLAVAMAIALG